MTTQSLVLQVDTHFRLPLPGRWRVSCVQGRIWVTASGDLQDHVLQGSESRIFNAGGSLLIGSLQASRLRLEWLGPLPLQSVAGWRARFRLLMQRGWQYPASRFYAGSAASARQCADEENRYVAGRKKGEWHRVEQGVCRELCEKLD